MIHYTYRIDNLINGKYYIGKHSSDSLNDNYMGSGPLIKAAIAKYGIENFKKTILEIFPTSEEAFEHEAQIVTMVEVDDPMCYNIQPGGKGGQKRFTDEELREHKLELLKEYYQRPEVKERISKYRKEYNQQNKERISKRRKEYDQQNKERILKRHKEYNQQNKESLSKRRREYYQRPEVKERRRKYLKEYNQQNKESLSKRRKEYYQRPEVKERISKHQKEYQKEYRRKKREQKQYNISIS